MPLRIACPGCREQFEVHDGHTNDTVACPQCSMLWRVKKPEPPVATAIPSQQTPPTHTQPESTNPFDFDEAGASAARLKDRIEEDREEIPYEEETPPQPGDWMIKRGGQLFAAFIACLVIGRAIVSLIPGLKGSGLTTGALLVLIPIWSIGGIGLLLMLLGVIRNKLQQPQE